MKQLIYIFALLFLLAACERNHAPIISEIKYQPETTSAGTIFTLSVVASDEDGDPLDYLWSSNGGEFLTPPDSREVDWRSPSDGEGSSFVISARVTDGEFQSSRELILSLTEPVLGGIKGTVCFQNTRIPIEGVSILLAGKEALTDQRGEYSISGLVSRQDTLRASKNDFGPKEVVVSIPPEAILHYDFEMLSITKSCKVSGTVRDQEDLPVRNAEIVMINPTGTESRLRGFTDDNGNYKILYVPHGDRKIIVRKEINEEYRYTELEEEISFTEIEQRVDFVMEKVSLRGVFVDIRDGREYPFKTIGNSTWMQTNLAYLPEVHPSSEISDKKPLYYVYNYDGTDTTEAKSLSSYRDYGVLYNWQAAKRSCPLGWHLPSRGEWYNLVNELWPNPSDKMRTASGWVDDTNARNTSGFSAMPAGRLRSDGKFSGMEREAYFYSSEQYSSGMSWFCILHSASPNVWITPGQISEAYSVRCVRNK